MISLSEKLREGRRLARVAHVEKDKAAIGNLRAGNSGVMSEQGDIAASCHRKAHLRQLGLEVDPPDESRQIMFQLGVGNEDLVYNDLVHTLPEGYVILREEEIPITWMTSNGTKVTGRPDMVICQRTTVITRSETMPSLCSSVEKVVPVLGIEIKSIASVWTSRDILGDRQPKLEHLVQAAHYSWQLGEAALGKGQYLPFRLVYRQYAIQEIPSFAGKGGAPGWGAKLFPKQGEPGSEHIDYERGRVQPFEIVYELGWTGAGRLTYRVEGSSERPVGTVVTAADIRRYYEYISTMAEKGELGPRPMTISAQGKEKSWDMCSGKYCPLASVCDKVDKSKGRMGYQDWLDLVKIELGKS